MTNFTAASGNTLGLAIMGDNRIGMVRKIRAKTRFCLILCCCVVNDLRNQTP
jgi:hypothetical protein